MTLSALRTLARTGTGWAAAVLAACGLLLSACGPAPQAGSGPRYENAPGAATPSYRFAVNPFHNPKKLLETYQPLIDHLNTNLPPAHFELEASRDFATYETRFRAREPHFLLLNPWQALEAMKAGYHVLAISGDAADFRGIFIVRRDSPIRTPADLKGKQVAYPSPTALAAGIMPQWYLHQKGIDIRRDISNRYVGSHESSIMNAYLGDVAVAATYPPAWRTFQKDRPQEAAQLKVLWETPALVNNALMVRNDVPAPLADKVRARVLTLHESTAGRIILDGMEAARMHPANDSAYRPVREFIARFEREVRPVDQH